MITVPSKMITAPSKMITAPSKTIFVPSKMVSVPLECDRKGVSIGRDVHRRLPVGVGGWAALRAGQGWKNIYSRASM